MDYIRWSVETEGMDAEVIEITDFLEQRITFLNEVWLENREYYLVRADQGFGAFYGYFAVYPGECLEPLPNLEASADYIFKGWFYTETNEQVDFSEPITKDIEIYAKWEESQGKQIKQVAKLVPLGVIAIIGIVLAGIAIKRMKRSR